MRVKENMNMLYDRAIWIAVLVSLKKLERESVIRRILRGREESKLKERGKDGQ